MKPIRLVSFPAALALLACLAPGARGQTVVLDHGTFRLSIAGREVGRDSFDIRRTGSGDEARVFAQGWVELEGRQLTTILETSGAHAFTAYQATISGAERAEIRARLNGPRLEMTVVSPAGERTRELRARDGAVLLEQNVPHHYYFVGALAREGASLPVMVPRVDDQAVAAVQSIVRESVTVAGRQLDARRLGLSSGGVETRMWIDAEGRVLRVEIPSTGFLAERLAPPQ
jgi:hypothetical protein